MNEPTPFHVAGWSAAPITRAKLFLLVAVFLLLVAVFLLVCPFSARSQILVTFDDLSETGTGDWLPTGYQGLAWSNFWCNNAILYTNILPHWGVPPQTGNFFGMVSPSNVAYNALASPAEIDSTHTNFNFLSVYLTGDLNSNLNIEVEGFNGAQEIYDTIVVASATNPTLFTFDYFNIDRLYFNAYGGEPAFGGGYANTVFVMDNFMFEFIPEPSTVLLTLFGVGVLTVWGLRKRGRPNRKDGL